MNPPDCCARILIRRRGHGTGVQNHEFSFFASESSLHTLCAKLCFNRSPIRLGSAASEIFHIEAGHTHIVPDAVHSV
jgi:hypothetical protein